MGSERGIPPNKQPVGAALAAGLLFLLDSQAKGVSMLLNMGVQIENEIHRVNLRRKKKGTINRKPSVTMPRGMLSTSTRANGIREKRKE